MTAILETISIWSIPVLVACVSLYAIIKKVPVYSVFLYFSVIVPSLPKTYILSLSLTFTSVLPENDDLIFSTLPLVYHSFCTKS